jgi:hypothetical protein
MLSNEKNILYLKITIFTGLLLLGWALFSYSKLIYRSYQLDQKMQWFDGENERLVSGNKALAEEFEYIQTEFFLERAAKEQLHKKQRNEKVIVIQEPQEEFAKPLSHEEMLRIRLNSLTNPQKWWYYFFGTEQLLEDL